MRAMRDRKPTNQPTVMLCVVLAWLAACSDDAVTASPCGEIPTTGCPVARGIDVCGQDASCTATYSCVGTSWKLAQTCPRRVQDASSDSPTDAGRETSVQDASIAIPAGGYGGEGCTALEPPDCTAAAGIVCPSGCCGCEDLFVCTSGAWFLWGACDNGQIRQVAAQITGPVK